MKAMNLRQRFGFALLGIRETWATEMSFRIQILLGFVGILVFAMMKAGPVWWAFYVMATSAVLAAEVFNTAIEKLADHVHPEMHPHIKIVKDASAGGVLIASLGAVAVFLCFLAQS